MSTAEVLKELEDSPEFLDHLAHLNQFAEDERRRREQFVSDLDDDTKAEFINGQVVVHWPARFAHLGASQNINRLIDHYVVRHDLGAVCVEKCLVRCTRNDYEPDICFFTQAKCAGWEPDKKIFPPPDLVVEILSPSTERNDRTVKLQDYARHGVGEYWIVDADAESVEQYTLPPGANEFRLNARLIGQKSLVSMVLAGFTVPVSAFFHAQANREALRVWLDQR